MKNKSKVNYYIDKLSETQSLPDSFFEYLILAETKLTYDDSVYLQVKLNALYKIAIEYYSLNGNLTQKKYFLNKLEKIAINNMKLNQKEVVKKSSLRESIIFSTNDDINLNDSITQLISNFNSKIIKLTDIIQENIKNQSLSFQNKLINRQKERFKIRSDNKKLIKVKNNPFLNCFSDTKINKKFNFSPIKNKNKSNLLFINNFTLSFKGIYLKSLLTKTSKDLLKIHQDSYYNKVEQFKFMNNKINELELFKSYESNPVNKISFDLLIEKNIVDYDCEINLINDETNQKVNNSKFDRMSVYTKEERKYLKKQVDEFICNILNIIN